MKKLCILICVLITGVQLLSATPVYSGELYDSIIAELNRKAPCDCNCAVFSIDRTGQPVLIALSIGKPSSEDGYVMGWSDWQGIMPHVNSLGLKEGAYYVKEDYCAGFTVERKLRSLGSRGKFSFYQDGETGELYLIR
ncbi:MAG: hypothetical protein PQJ58_21800 [Spirochaetales bacterium]|nr:hypothetical protein [Spirochaetales bacterium]